MKLRTKFKIKKRKIKTIIFLFVFILGITITYKFLDNTKIEIKDKKLVTLLLSKSNIIKEKSTYKKTKEIIKKIYQNPKKLLLINTKEKPNPNKTAPVAVKENSKKEPLIYIYNSHQTEEYAPSTFLEYSVKPTVMMADYILEEKFAENNYKTIVEESSIKEILNNNSWKYSYSYKASRILLEKRKKENPSLKYYIDVHRDSLSKDKTTIEINGKLYAKTIFLIGLENSSYEENLKFTTKINDCLNQKYPNLSKGIYKKGGEGVNGVYNQDFSPYAILIEIGGYENTTTEVMNSSLAFSTCFMEVIKTNEAEGIN